MYKFLLSMGLSILLSAPALAQTAEETVALIVFGLREHALLLAKNATAKAVQTKIAGGIQFLFIQHEGNKEIKLRVRVRAIDKCNYQTEAVAEVENLLKTLEEYTGTLNFSNVTNIVSINAPGIILVGNQIFCRKNANTCETNPHFLQIAEASIGLITRAYLYFQENYCKGRVF